jgi:hypothetical protein
MARLGLRRARLRPSEDEPGGPARAATVTSGRGGGRRGGPQERHTVCLPMPSGVTSACPGSLAVQGHHRLIGPTVVPAVGVRALGDAAERRGHQDATVPQAASPAPGGAPHGRPAALVWVIEHLVEGFAGVAAGERSAPGSRQGPWARPQRSGSIPLITRTPGQQPGQQSWPHDRAGGRGRCRSRSIKTIL